MMATFTYINNETQELLNTFCHFIEYYENCTSLQLSFEVVKDSFEAASLIEKSVIELERKNLFPLFISCLNSWLQIKTRTLLYNENFYRIACDHLLDKHFCIKKDIEIAIKLYSLYCSRDRFQSFIANGIMRSSKYEPVLNFTVINRSNVNMCELQSRLLLFKWENDYNIGNYSHVQESIKKMLESYTVDKQLIYLILILNLNSKLKGSSVHNLILKEILIQMNDRSKLCENFWQSLIKSIDKNVLAQICLLYKDFLKSLVDFLVYFCCMMDYEIGNTRIWINNNKSICPEITYDNITLTFQSLINFDESLYEYIKTRIENSKITSETFIWNDIIKLCF